VNEREIVSFIIFTFRLRIRELDKRWAGGIMPDIPSGEYQQCKIALQWALAKMDEVLERDYGFKSKGNEL
jgi:hypothetical protein